MVAPGHGAIRVPNTPARTEDVITNLAAPGLLEKHTGVGASLTRNDDITRLSAALGGRVGTPYSPIARNGYSIVGFIGTLIVIPALVMQVRAIIRRKAACDISFWYLIGLFVTNALWCVYSLGNDVHMAALSAAGTMLVVAFIFGLKMRYQENCSERTLAE